jgi:hypothetical protein
MTRRRLVQLLAVVALAVSIGATAPAVAQFVSAYVGRTFTSTAPSGTAGFACRTLGCQVDLGPGATDHLYSPSAGNIQTPGSFIASGNSTAGTALYAGIGSNATTVRVGALRIAVGIALPTCVAGEEGSLLRLTGTGGTGSLSQTRFCACVSDGAASPVYSWRNLISGTAGNSTTCNP